MASLASHDERPYVVPDFIAEEEIRARYQAVVRELVNAAITKGVNALRSELALERQRLAVAAQIAARAQNAAESVAHTARARYAKIVPRQRTASGIVRPPTIFFDNVMSMGAAGKYYNEATIAAQKRRDAIALARSAFAALERFTGTCEAALVVRELEIRRHFKSENGRLELDDDPRLHEIAVKCASIEAERAEFQRRFDAGEVSDEELRDRTMAQDGSRYLDGNLRGLHCLRERNVKFGKLRYFTFRDREGGIWLLDYSDDLRLLMQITFDVVYVNDRYVISRSASDGLMPERERERNPEQPVPDPRAHLGIDPNLLRAIGDFVARERSVL